MSNIPNRTFEERILNHNHFNDSNRRPQIGVIRYTDETAPKPQVTIQDMQKLMEDEARRQYMTPAHLPSPALQKAIQAAASKTYPVDPTWVDGKKPLQMPTYADEPLLQFFDGFTVSTMHLDIAFRNLAYEIVKAVRRNPERTVALRKLLEAKDAAVRAATFK